MYFEQTICKKLIQDHLAEGGSDQILKKYLTVSLIIPIETPMDYSFFMESGGLANGKKY